MDNNLFEKLYSIDVSKDIEKKNNLSYLSWAAAVKYMSQNCDFDYEIERFKDKDGLEKPYIYDEKTGYMVFTNVTVNGKKKEMWLPVMDNNNNAMLDHDYKYRRWSREVEVKAATMFDINKTIMRCLTKNLGMFGLGLRIYNGEDIWDTDENNSKETSTSKGSQVFNDDELSIPELFDSLYSEQERTKIYEHYNVFDSSQLDVELLVKYVNDRRKNAQKN